MSIEERSGSAKKPEQIFAHLFFVAALSERRKSGFSFFERRSETAATVGSYPDVSAATSVDSPAESATAITSISTRAPFGSAAT